MTPNNILRSLLTILPWKLLKVWTDKSANFEMSHEKETKLVRNEKKIQIKILVFNKSLYKQQMFIRDKCSLKCGLYDIFFEFYYI